MQASCGLSRASWNCMLSGLLKRGKPHKTLQLFRQMQQEGVPADSKTIAVALQACCKLLDMEDACHFKASFTLVDPLQIGMALHADARRKDVASNPFLGAILLNLYGKCGHIATAEMVFAQLCTQDVVPWTTMLSMYVDHHHAQTALHMFKQMLEYGVLPNKRTFVIAIQACCKLAEQEESNVKHGSSTKVLSLRIGQALHEDVLRVSCADVFIDSALVSMYGKCGHLAEAEHVFCGMSQGDIVSWNAMLLAYVEQEKPTKALQLFSIVQKEGCMSPNALTYVAALQACCLLAAKEEVTIVDDFTFKLVPLEIGRALHCDAKMIGLASHVFVGSALVSMYSKCGSISDAEIAFGGLSHRNVVTWNAMLSACVDQEQGDKALFFYELMLDEGLSFNDISLTCILSACSETCHVEVCRQIHHAIASECDTNAPMVSTLIRAYGSCAYMEDAQATFDTVCHPDIVPWNALCAGHVQDGNHMVALQAFNEMQLADLKADDISFLLLLSACNHSGLADIGVEYLELILQQYGKIVISKHFVILVDLLGRAGNFCRIEHLFSKWQVHSDLQAWLCLLKACQIHGNLLLGKWAFDRVMLLQGEEPTAYVLMSNIYADAGLRTREMCESLSKGL